MGELIGLIHIPDNSSLYLRKYFKFSLINGYMSLIKKRLKNGEAVIGTFISLGNPITTEIIGTASWDWVMIDLEHGLGSESDVLSQLQSLAGTNIESFVRIEGPQRQRIHKVLDMGVNGVMCPHIDTAEEALMVTRAMRYAPGGLRGVAKLVRATNFGLDFDEYHAKQEENLLTIIQIENNQALDNLEAIASNPGIDVLFIGPADLSMSLGVFGQLDHPKFLEAESRIIKTAKKYNRSVGFLMMDPGDFKKYYARGIRFFACGTDAFFLKNENKVVADRLVAYRDGIQK